MKKIPKIIHFCWFGNNPFPENVKRCIASWKKFCPNYRIIKWSEKNFDINSNDYVREAYEEKKWAFVSDFVRLYVLVKYGGIYMDTDVEVIKPLDSLLKYDAVSGFENDKAIPTGLMACCKGHKLFDEFLHEYDNIHFRLENGSCDTTSNVKRITNTCLKYGFKQNNSLQVLEKFTILPKDYLCPKDCETGKLQITENTLAIHHFNGSWLSEEEQFYYNKIRLYCKIFPLKLAYYLAEFARVVKYQGLFQGIKDLCKWVFKKIKRIHPNA